MFYNYKYQQRCPERCPAGSFPYTIKAGDTLYFIARTYNTTVEAIMAINLGLDPYNLQIGQVICVPTMASPVPPCPGGFYYTIRPGDTLYLIGQRFNVTVDALIRANPGIDPNNLQVGQVICIPASQPLPPCPGGFYYTIKAGDTLFKLAQQFNVTVSAIIAANPGIDPNNLRVGQIICIPASQPLPPCPGGFYYTIQPGDTLYLIGQRFNVTIDALIRANPGIDPNNLQVGQVICIPASQPLPPCPGGFYYTIKAGDTLFKLAQQFNVTVSAIIAANPGIDPNNLQIGQIICIPSSSPVPPCSGFYYTIKAGDTLFKLAQQFNVTVSAIIAANPGIDPNNLQIGQIICIPAPPPISCPGGQIYVVKENDNLASILVKFDISVADLLVGNPDLDINRIVPGQKLCILPHKSRTCPSGKTYVITCQDIKPDTPTVVVIAEKFVVSVSDLMIVNPDLAPSDFIEGTRICIPSEEAPV